MMNLTRSKVCMWVDVWMDYERWIHIAIPIRLPIWSEFREEKKVSPDLVFVSTGIAEIFFLLFGYELSCAWAAKQASFEFLLQ